MPTVRILCWQMSYGSNTETLASAIGSAYKGVDLLRGWTQKQNEEGHYLQHEGGFGIGDGVYNDMIKAVLLIIVTLFSYICKK